MAAAPKKSPAATFPSKEVTSDWLERLRCARAQKTLVEKDLQEAYFFTRPRLSRQVSSTAPVRPKDSDDAASELATSIGSEVSEDFATEVIAAFFPQGTLWALSGADAALLAGVEDDELDQFKADILARDTRIFAAINSSNFNAELGTACDPDAAIGTIGMWITSPGGGRPYKCEHVPTRELEVDIDPSGAPGARFRVRHVAAAKLRAVIGSIPLPPAVEAKIAKQPKQPIEVAWGFDRDWSRPHDDVFDHALLVDKQVVHQQKLVGEGSLPLLVMRFSPDRLHAWGNGPAIKALQDFRVLDVITAATQDHVDVAINKPIGYPDDGVLDFEGGIESGKAYPMRPGSGRDVVPLYFDGDADLGFYTVEALEKKVRRKFFADYPEQKGDTPPTATQWVDEMVRSQRRIGTPGMKFWREGPYEVFRRFEWLLEREGRIPEVKLNGQKVSVSPNNPATQAQDNQKLQVATQLLTLAKNLFPETSQAAIDELRTIEKIKTLLKDEIVVLRDPALVENLIGQVLGAAVSGSMGGQGAPPAA